MNLDLKLAKLRDILLSCESVAVAYSGGVDSTFLLRICKDVLNDKVIAVTASSSTYPERELNNAIKYAEDMNCNHIIIQSEELDIEGFSKNPVNRCYYCKKELFSKIRKTADKYNIKEVLDGSNYDDIGDFRPGMQAASELFVISPLMEAGLTKEEIRELSKKLNLPTWDKPSCACLSSRFPYGNEITKVKLNMVDKAEQFLLNEGFKQIRVRHHGDIARIEVSPGERNKFFDVSFMDKVDIEFKKIGFKYVTLDLKGYRTGSMNEVLNNI